MRLLAALVVLMVAASAAGAARPTDAVIVVSPHPDDETILAAGTIHRVAATRGTYLAAIYVSGGDKASKPGPCNGIPEARKAKRIVRLREHETRAAWKILAPHRRVPLHFLRGPDQGLVASSTLTNGVRQDVYTPAGERAIAGVVAVVARLPRSIVRVRFITAARYDGHPDHRTAYEATRRAALALRARDVAVHVSSFIVHDEFTDPNPSFCCLGDLHWPSAGAADDYTALVDSTARPRPPRWDTDTDVSDQGTVRHDALVRHVSQVAGWPKLCMFDGNPGFYTRWWQKQEEPFYEETVP